MSSVGAVACSSAPTDPGASLASAVTPATNLHEFGTRNAHVAVCSPSADPRAATCAARVVTDERGAPLSAAASTSTNPSGYGAADLANAYGIPTYLQTNATIAIIATYDDPNDESDLAVYRSTYGLPPCTTANGCFRKVNAQGAASPLQPVNTGWAMETSLDLDMASAACPACKILLVEAPNTNPGAGIDEAVSLGAAVVSCSFVGHDASQEAHYDHPGVAIFAATGDGGFVSPIYNGYPAQSANVVAVGGTALTNPGKWSQSAWAGASSGCSNDPKPAWQKDSGCAFRTVGDVSAVASPDTAVAVYDTYGQSGWIQLGGTSASTPLVAGIYALTGNGGQTGQYAYAHTRFFSDVTSGSNGTCSNSTSYLCTGVTGYDAPTGIGTPFGALMAGVNTTALTAAPSYQTVSPGSTSNVLLSAVGYWAAPKTLGVTVSGLPDGVTAFVGPFGGTWGNTNVAVTFYASAGAPSEQRTVTITATDNGTTYKTTMELIVAPAATGGDAGAGGDGSVLNCKGGTVDCGGYCAKPSAC